MATTVTEYKLPAVTAFVSYSHVDREYGGQLRRLAKITWRLLEIGAILESSTGEVGRW